MERGDNSVQDMKVLKNPIEYENLGHGSGVEHVLTELRARFWIIKGRRTVRNTIEKCPGCRRRFTGKPTTQMMAVVLSGA